MSRIFDALQRSEAERTGIEFSELPTLATDLLQIAERQVTKLPRPLPVEEYPSQAVMPLAGTNLVSLVDPEGLAAEKFRFLSVRLRQMQQVRGLNKLLITSTSPEEGKSMISANLAFTLARKKRQKVLLLEGDLRRPVLCTRLGLGKPPGLVEWLHGDGGASPNIFRLEETGVCFLAAGTPPENPLELIQLPKLAGLLEQLASRFDWIILDSPPVLPLADTSVWARFADGVLLVVREGMTEKRELTRGLEALDKSKLLGVVVNSCTNADHANYYVRYGPMSQSKRRAEN
jgi:capsular exopolysaccharide synthesis family protein